ncbi:MAG: MerR family transcriptional regulator [Prevotella sp.]|nr:MerR family transcriptional regulator [Prevotella sp.]MCD8305276.1 MerR family transcriptional regulator [Prevotella sp.]
MAKEKDAKLYYSIKEVATMFGVAESTLRYWEKEFPQVQPKTSGRGVRQYTLRDIEEIRLIHNMVKIRGFHLDAAKKMLAANRTGADRSAQIIATLTALRSGLTDIKAQLDRLV